MPHLDDLAGAFVRLPQLFSPKPRNTIDRLDAYRGIGMDTFFPAPTAVPPTRLRRRWSLRGVVSEDIVFRSLHDPIEPNFREYYHARRRRVHTVYAKRIRPTTTRPNRPRLLYVHGYMQPETVIEEVALLTTMSRMLDMEIIQLQPPYHGRRKPRASAYAGELFWTADIVRSLESVRQVVLDARTLLSILLRESTAPVGVAGLSLGGTVSAILTCIEPRFAFSAPFIAHMDLAALLRDAPVLASMRKDLAGFGWSADELSELLSSMGWDDLRPVIPTERILLFGAEDDRFFRPELVRDMWERWERPEAHWYPTSHMGFIPYVAGAVSKLRSFVDRVPADAQPPR